MRRVVSISLAVFFSTAIAVAQSRSPGSQTPQIPAGPGIPLPPRDQPRLPAKTGTSIIRGRVVSTESGQPLRRVQIRASAPELPEGRSTTTDDEGRFELRELPSGRFTLMATKGGYITVFYGQRRPQEPGRPIQLADGQMMDKVDFNLPRGSVIAGRVVDEVGEPVTGAMIQILSSRVVAGERQLNPVGPPVSNQTNDLGEFRAFGLPPGSYYLMASLRSAFGMGLSDDRTGYAPTYYPGTPSIGEAQLISIGTGQELTGLTVPLMPSRTATVSGSVLDSDGKPFTRGNVSLRQSLSAFGGGMGFVGWGGGQLKPDGSFIIPNVVPGDYVLEARANDFGPASEFASMDLTVAGEDLAGLSLVALKAAAARGRIAFEGDKPPTGIHPSQVNIYVQPTQRGAVMMGPSQSTVHDDWTFEVNGLMGQRSIFVGAPPTWFLKSIQREGVDITDSPIEFKGSDVNDLEIVLTQKVTDVSGSVMDHRGAPVKEYVLVMFAEDRDRWSPRSRFIRAARPDQDGRFTVRGLPPERYVAIALESLEPGEERNLELLEQLKTLGTSVALHEGETRTLDLKLSAY